MNKKYYFITYRIDLGNSRPCYGKDVIDCTPLEYTVHHQELGGSYSNRCILYAQEISQVEYEEYKELFEND